MSDSMLGLASRFARRYFGALAAVIWMATGMITVPAEEVASIQGDRLTLHRPYRPVARAQRTLPVPNYDVLIDGTPHVFSKGNFYVPVRRGAITVYAQVRLPYGATVEGLPIDWRVIEIDGKTYYRNGSNFFRRVDRTGEVAFRIARPPAGVVLDHVPPAQHAYKQGGSTFRVADGVCYEEILTDQGMRFRVVDSRL
jgi:hypothetical protein